MSNIKLYKTYLPLFSGFYETIWDERYREDIELENINDDRAENGLDPLDPDEIEFDIDGYRQEIIEDIADWLKHNIDFIKDIKIEELVSPREYNFRNDSVNIQIRVDIDVIKQKIEQYWDGFYQFIKGTYKSAPGFIPGYSNNAYDWWEDSKGMTDFTGLDHQLGVIIEFILDVEEWSEQDIYENNEVLPRVKNYEYEINKIRCQNCYEFFNTKDEYNKELEYQLEVLNKVGTRVPGLKPHVKSFGQWLKTAGNVCPICGTQNKIKQ